MSIRDFEDRADNLHIKLVAPDGRVVFQKDRTLIRDSLYEYVDVRDPQLWFPRGYGEQPLYELTLSTPTSTKTQKVGIRKITVLQLEDEDGSEESRICEWLCREEHLKDRERNKRTAGFTVLVNGIKIMCKGGNWVPSEPFVSAETPEKITRLLELSADA